ncbi:cytochrome P450 71D7-like [Coffea arabica]|uniref:Cytochrome P450 71D7-like n=1 Tax=Coffea arabica TaxID=13443 RepID=A0A6P6SY36_COFAR
MELPSNFIACFLFLAFISALIKRRKRPKAAQKLPPSPWKLPLVGHMHHLLGSAPHRALAKLAQKHGPLMHLQLGEISSVVVSSPRLAREIMKTHDLAFADRSELLATKIVCYNNTNIAGSPYGAYWRQMRKICNMELLGAEKVRSFGSIRQDEALHLISSISAAAKAGVPINLTRKLSTYTSSMVFRAAFGKACRHHKDTFLQVLKEALPLVSSFGVSDLFPSYKILHSFSWVMDKFAKVHQKIDVIFDNIIAEHVENLARTNKGMGESGDEDLIDVLLRIKASYDLQVPITNNNIKAVLIDIFSAGTETASSTVEWAMAEMIRNPHALAKAQSEIRKAFMGKATITEETDLQELKYLKMVIKETLRMHPTGAILVPRECREECEIDGYLIPVKTRVLVNAWALGRDPEYWDDPESFRPERFENKFVDFAGTHFEYLPFGAGRRICPGISFGLANIELPLALLLYHFDWKLPDGFNSNDLDMSENGGLAASRKHNLCLLASLHGPALDMACQTPTRD